MILIKENPKNPTDFTLYLSAVNQIIVTNSENESFQQIHIPEPILPENLTKGQIEIIKKEKRTITWMEHSKDNKYIAVTTENKQLVVFDETFQIIKNITLARVASKVCFSSDNDVIVADRTGDVYLYKIDQQTEPVFLLGHLSIILDMLVTECGNYIITCDRDEKIKVSHYPNTYNIKTFCLGHEEFVTCIKLLKSNDVLISASGDGTVRMWNYKEGKQINIIDTSNLVDEKTLENFTKQMDSKKVDITKLPIVNMQINENSSNAILALSLYSVAKLFLYTINLKSLDHTPLGNLDIETVQFSYCLCNNLYILSTNKFEIYSLSNFDKMLCKKIQDKLLQYKQLFVIEDNDITMLYKRKFDNVQEYKERKKRRLEAK